VFLGKSLKLDYSSTYDKALVGFMHSYNVLSYSVSSLGKVISMSIESKDISPVSETVSGPVGIYNVVGAIVKHSEDKVFLSLIDFTAMLSLSLAFLNILPLPALDGGRLFFVLIELLRGGKKVSAELEARIHGIGMFLLLSLFVLITIKDIAL
jgi:RIP metalloprotease RseP